MFTRIAFYFTLLFSVTSWAKAIIDPDVLEKTALLQPKAQKTLKPEQISVLVFLKSIAILDSFIADIKNIPSINVQKLEGFPAVLVYLSSNKKLLIQLANHHAVRQISSYLGSKEELKISDEAILIKPLKISSTVSNWWDNAYTGLHSAVGIIDTGIDTEHPGLRHKNLIIRTEKGSGYDDFKNGVRAEHGTGIACIFAGLGGNNLANEIAIANGSSTIISGLAGTETGDAVDKLAQTLSTLDWMLNRAPVKPDVINYSFGNGPTNCMNCPDWSGIAKFVDYVVNKKHILWVKSAGNGGYIQPAKKAPFNSTMTTPADNYNALTVANMNPSIIKEGAIVLNPDRSKHVIYYNSSRGPTLIGRKKPDLSAPGHATRTCAPDPASYPFTYTKEMDYRDGYRLMGGTSSAAPHVGAAALLLHNAGITSPMAKKAILINSAEAFTDSDQPGPDDPNYPYQGGHYAVKGSEWNRTYGWGYLNTKKAYDERYNLIQDHLTLQKPERIYEIFLPIGGKVTLVHERRVGYNKGREWRLSHLSLQILKFIDKKIIMKDSSPIDTVHQVANCKTENNKKWCSSLHNKPMHVLVKVKLLSKQIEGGQEEPFALAFSK
ncbi:MAG: S8 family serine peptidase [Tatlockia sp.]|nr:S8 family serine peptidase [Tatlockia sp.]